jgi:predicted transcriptional regulator
MTPNEKELLEKFKRVAKASAITMSKEMNLSVDYTQTICNRLVEKGLLKVATPGRWPVYKIKEIKGKGK